MIEIGDKVNIDFTSSESLFGVVLVKREGDFLYFSGDNQIYCVKDFEKITLVEKAPLDGFFTS